MSKFVLSIVTVFALSVGMAFAQAYPSGSQSSPSASPGMQQPQQTPGQPGDNPSMGQSTPGTANSTNQQSAEKGEKKLKGCVQAQGSQAMLETKKGKEIALTGQDVSAHNGHEVEVKGSWESGGTAGTPTAAGASGEKTFNVTDVKMISDTCKGKSKGSSETGTGATGASPSGSSSSSPSGTVQTTPSPTTPQ
jgi:hypothetical protein